jgi:recombination protein RecA
MASSDDLVAQFNKTYGKATATVGVALYNTPRQKTGIFEFDLGTGGGLPIGKITEIFGPESSGKTNLLLSAAGEAQRDHPGAKVAIIDQEDSLSSAGKWISNFLDPDRLLIIRPDYAEAVVDMAEKLVEAEDICFLGIDSIAAMVATAELEKSAEGHTMGGNSIVVQKLIRKLVAALARVNKQYETGQRTLIPPPVVLINQIRHQIGVMFGSPEKTPGGFAPKFAAALRVRTYGRNIVDKKISDTMPTIKQTDIVIQKWKVPIISTAIKYDMVTIPHGGFEVRQTKAWNMVEAALKSMGHLHKGEKDKGWVMFGEPYPTLIACMTRFHEDAVFRQKLLTYLIKQGLNDPEAVPPAEGELAEEVVFVDPATGAPIE